MSNKDVYIISEEDTHLSLESVLGNRTKGKKGASGRKPKRAPGSSSFQGSGHPRLAATFSMWLSGTGHFLHREWKLGTLYFLALSFILSFHYFLHHGWSQMRSLVGRIGLGEADLFIGVILVDLYLLLVLLSGIHSAYRIGRAYAGEEEEPSPNPILAATASVLIPGWGQIINGQIRKAMFFLFFFFTLILGLGLFYSLKDPVSRLVLGGGDPLQTLLVGFSLAGYGIVVWSLSIYDAVLVARFRRTGIA